MTRDELPSFLNIVARRLLSHNASGVSRRRIAKRLDLKAQFDAVKPKQATSDNVIEAQAQWMANFIRATVPESAICERALQKAEARGQQLAPRGKIADVDLSNFGKVVYVNVPARPITRPAREVMVRQVRNSKPHGVPR